MATLTLVTHFEFAQRSVDIETHEPSGIKYFIYPHLWLSAIGFVRRWQQNVHLGH